MASPESNKLKPGVFSRHLYLGEWLFPRYWVFEFGSDVASEAWGGDRTLSTSEPTIGWHFLLLFICLGSEKQSTLTGMLWWHLLFSLVVETVSCQRVCYWTFWTGHSNSVRIDRDSSAEPSQSCYHCGHLWTTSNAQAYPHLRMETDSQYILQVMFAH